VQFETFLAISNLTVGITALDEGSLRALAESLDIVLGIPIGCCSSVVSDAVFVHRQLTPTLTAQSSTASSVTIIAYLFTNFSTVLFPSYQGQSATSLFHSLRVNLTLSAASGRLQRVFRSRSVFYCASQTFFAAIGYRNVTSVNLNTIHAPTTAPFASHEQAAPSSPSSDSSAQAVVISSALLGLVVMAAAVLFVAHQSRLKAKKLRHEAFFSAAESEMETFSSQTCWDSAGQWFELQDRNPTSRERVGARAEELKWEDLGFESSQQLPGRPGGPGDNPKNQVGFDWAVLQNGGGGDSTVWFRGPGPENPTLAPSPSLSWGELGLDPPQSLPQATQWFSAPRREELFSWNEYGPLNDRLDRRYLLPAAGEGLRATEKVKATVQKGQGTPRSAGKRVSDRFSRRLFAEYFASKTQLALFKAQLLPARKDRNQSEPLRSMDQISPRVSRPLLVYDKVANTLFHSVLAAHTDPLAFLSPAPVSLLIGQNRTDSSHDSAGAESADDIKEEP